MVLQCSNPTCRADTSLPLGRCQVCQTPLLYRFLLAVSELDRELPPYTIVANRFQVWQHPIWLDTQPEVPLQPLANLPPQVLPYLRLSELAQHIPRPYYYLTAEESRLAADVLLLEAAPLGLKLDDQDQVEATLLPTLTQAWAQGTALQQLNWLRQIAALWPLLAQQQVTATLLSPEQLRVDQALLRLTRLVPDPAGDPPITLASLGSLWSNLVETAQPAIQAYLDWLVTALGDGWLTSSTTLVEELQQAIQILAQGLSVGLDWVADTDQGPSRDRNEDACYPQAEPQHQVLSQASVTAQALPLLLVCDGIGGHEQGNIASQTAIQLLREALQPLAQQPDLSPSQVAHHLKQAIIQANNAIVSRNDDEQRSARARMGTTVVVALVHFPYLSIAHLGDSRAYRVSAQTCYQITVDDDVASRETHLGYALYQEAVQMPGGGALVQALGINDSGYLYPTVQHLLLDDPSVWLLCSDGLSDYDRIEALWPFTVRPLVGHTEPLTPVVEQLIQQANRLNGHDNVTVGLLRLDPKITALPTLPGARLIPLEPESRTTDRPGLDRPTLSPPLTPVVATAPAVPVASRRPPWRALFSGAAVSLLVLAAAGWAYSRQRPQPVGLRPTAPAWPVASIAGQPLFPRAQALTADIPVGSFWQVSPSAAFLNQAGALRLAASPPPAADPGIAPPLAPSTPMIPAGSILRVLNRQTLADRTQWVRLQVCSIPAGASLQQVPRESAPTNPTTPTELEAQMGATLAQQLSQPGDEGWTRAHLLYGGATALDTVTRSQAGRCPFTP
ncbi:MAG TPA: protein phosphatase 2C domain-containing protein [Leptolyngbyaceae cyanobacterium M65_K2018_010]|nr:protein phosphatase 2C domain-containing protein [Leptolyngbyaceae cyanobacterium M65_K2018_010]